MIAYEQNQTRSETEGETDNTARKDFRYEKMYRTLILVNPVWFI